MQLTPRSLLTQFAHLLQQSLFPALQSEIGELSCQMQLLTSALALVPITGLLNRGARTGRPARDRAALASAFLAKAVLNLPTTRDLIDRLKVDEALRRICGWKTVCAIPHESKFSRAFAEFANLQLPQRLHEAMVRETQKERLIGHIARDATAIPVRERVEGVNRRVKTRKTNQAKVKVKKRRTGKSGHKRAKASERGTRMQRQRHQNLETMLQDLPRTCDVGAKKNHHGNLQFWTGYKLHLDVADGQVPISAILTSASVHDSQVAIPLMTLSSQRVTYLYELMDSAYDADLIHQHSRGLNHVPIVAPHPRRAGKRVSRLTKTWVPTHTALDWAEKERYKERTMSERVNARLKDEFGASHIRVRGPSKVMAHLMFGVLALMADQLLRFVK